MTFTKDFITDTRGDLYPVLAKSGDCVEAVVNNRWCIRQGSVIRLLGQFFPYATYTLTLTVRKALWDFFSELQTRKHRSAMTEGSCFAAPERHSPCRRL